MTKTFELLKYETPDDTDSMSHYGSIVLDLSNMATIEMQVLIGLKLNGVSLKKTDLGIDLECGVIEVLNSQGESVFQLRD